MRVQVNTITLEGADRTVSFEPGLNIVTGPIASGKTTLVRYLRFLLGASLGHPPIEARENVTSVSGSVELADNSFSIMRPAVSTVNARVEIAGPQNAWRLPARLSPDGETYVNWLLKQLDLPRIDVPSAPTKPDSDTTPVSINDYFLYSYLSQDELGFSVFGHRDWAKNIKRRYVFEITYGYYDVNTAQIQERLRNVQGRLRELHSRKELFDTFFDGTPLENRMRIERELGDLKDQLAKTEASAVELASVPHKVVDTAQLQAEILAAERELGQVQAAIDAEQQSLRNLQDLVNQLESQSGKLTRSIVSDKHLTDLEFMVCPRCGSDVDSERASEDICYLCLHEPSLEFSREILIGEQGAVEQQLKEAQDLLGEREKRLTGLCDQLEDSRQELATKKTELDFQTKSYISEKATAIASTAARRARLTSRSEQLREYLDVLSKIDDSQKVAARLTTEKEALEQELVAATEESRDSQRKVRHLKNRFNEILEQLRPPRFGEQERSDINPYTYLPVYYGRPFNEVSSPGLATLINLSHALAHHVTSMELGLKLPQILIIDGLSEHLGQEGLDPARLLATYDLLIETSKERPDLQMIVVDNEIPEKARPFVRLELSEDDRLIRQSHG
ncbi:MAG: hypothetical protein OXQ89_22540 [Rhodospirillaceae bacterium]|nr:hypothetical protein [Rhodospirillaceae bacterium]